MGGRLVRLGLNGGPDKRALTPAFPQKGSMVLQRTSPPLLETPFEVFDPVNNRGMFTPNDWVFVRWHWAIIPEQVDLATFRVAVRGHVTQVQSLTMADILALPRVELAAINQCSGDSHGLFQRRIAGGQWENGAMGNAKWTGVRLRDVLDRADVKPGQTGFPTEPINLMVPRSFFTNVTPATTVKAGAPVPLRGIAFGGDCGVAAVDTSVDGGQTWQPAALGRDEGAYCFRQWTAQANAPVSGTLAAMVRCTNTRQVTQPMEANWNGGGFMRTVIEAVHLAVA